MRYPVFTAGMPARRDEEVVVMVPRLRGCMTE